MLETRRAPLDQILIDIESHTPEGIAAAVSRLIHGGQFVPGTRLPTVRQLAGLLKVSPATVSTAWHALAGAGLIHSRGRAGSFVLEPVAPWMPKHFRELGGASGPATRLDLSTGTPDPLLLPELGPALSRVPSRAHTENYYELRVLPELEKHLRNVWPSALGTVTITDGALDAISRCMEAVVRYGDRVVVEEPGFPPFLDLLEQLGARAVPVPIDGEGLLPAALSTALDLNPSAIIIQSRAHNPTGGGLSADRAKELMSVLRRKATICDPIIIEDDHSGEISTAPALSLGRWLPDRTLHVRSFSKSHGPDLRVGALGGPTQIIDRVLARRMLGPGWTSRMMQTVLFELLTAPTSVTQISQARMVYHARQRALSAALVAHGADHAPSDGINTWLRVRSERAALVALAAAGIKVAAGQTFYALPSAQDQFVRVTVGRLVDDFDQIGRLLAAASLAP